MRRVELQSTAQVPGTAAKRGRAAKPGGREARLEFRLTRAVRERIERAALASGQSLSEFAASTLAREAEAVLEKQHARLLSERDWERFSQALLHPPAPTPALQLAARAYQEAARIEGEAIVVDGAAWKQSLASDPDLLHDPH